MLLNAGRVIIGSSLLCYLLKKEEEEEDWIVFGLLYILEWWFLSFLGFDFVVISLFSYIIGFKTKSFITSYVVIFSCC